MPYKTQWVMPSVFMTRKKIKVYHTYKNDEVEQGENTYRFTLDPMDPDGFDVRNLSGMKLKSGQLRSFPDQGGFNAAARAAIKAALDGGELKHPHPEPNTLEL